MRYAGSGLIPPSAADLVVAKRRRRAALVRARYCAGGRVRERGTGHEGQAEEDVVQMPGAGAGLWVHFDSGALELVPGYELTLIEPWA